MAKVSDSRKTKAQLIEELQRLRQEVAELQKSEKKRKQTEEASVDLLQILMDNSPDYIFFKDRESRFIRTNKAHAQVLGLADPQEAVGKTDFDLFPREDAQRFYDEEQRIMESEQSVIAREWPILSSEGETVWVSEHKIPITDETGQVVGFVGITRDITERKRVEEALAHERDLLQALMDNIPDSIYFKDAASRFTRINRAQAQILGINDPKEALGKTDFDFFGAELAQHAYADEQEIIKSGQPLIGKVERAVKPDGEVRWFSATKAPIVGNEGQVTSIAGISRDITELKQAEEVLERRAVQLQTAAEVSRAASSILDLDELIQQVVDLARERFDLYYVGLFLVDETGEWTGEAGKWAMLRAGTGKAGRKMLEQGHRLEIGGTSMIGWCVANKQARIALDVGEEAVRFENPLLPETRSELALPLISRDLIIGAMTIQSPQEAAFSEEDIAVLQTMAGQVANAIENALLFEQTQHTGLLLSERIKDLDCLNDIGRKIEETPPVPEFLQWVAERIPPAMRAPDVCQVAIEFEGQIYGATEAVSLPCQIVQALRIGGEVVGRVYISYTEEGDFADEESALLGDIVRRVSDYIESRHLFEQTRAALAEMEATQRRYLQWAWTEYPQTAKTTSYETERPGAAPLGDAVLPEVQQAVERQSAMVLTGPSTLRHALRQAQGEAQDVASSEQGDGAEGPILRGDEGPVLSQTEGESHSALVAPIALRGEAIGALGIHDEDGARQWTDDEIALVEAVAERMALAAENLRLFEETQRRAARERLAREITDKIRRAADMDALMRIAVQELGQALSTSHTVIELGTELQER